MVLSKVKAHAILLGCAEVSNLLGCLKQKNRERFSSAVVEPLHWDSVARVIRGRPGDGQQAFFYGRGGGG